MGGHPEFNAQVYHSTGGLIQVYRGTGGLMHRRMKKTNGWRRGDGFYRIWNRKVHPHLFQSKVPKYISKVSIVTLRLGAKCMRLCSASAGCIHLPGVQESIGQQSFAFSVCYTAIMTIVVYFNVFGRQLNV